MKLTLAQREPFAQAGYFLLDAAVEPHRLEPLRAAAARVTQKTRSAEWPHQGDAGDGGIRGAASAVG